MMDMQYDRRSQGVPNAPNWHLHFHDRRQTPTKGFDWLDGETLQAVEFQMLPTDIRIDANRAF